MIILGIETSCDETAVSVVRASGGRKNPKFEVLSNLILSQAKLHEKYGGVFPSLAKREHAKNIVPLLETALIEAGLFKKESDENLAENALSNTESAKSAEKRRELEEIKKILGREVGLYEQLVGLVSNIKKPAIDRIAVTFGPGLEPALWVGINTAKALGLFWDIEVTPVNHMEGHICSVLLGLREPIEFPAIALLISGGHTELVYIEDWEKYKIIGETRDDAVGEVFDKVARMLGFPYPGGPKISELAEEERARAAESAGDNGDEKTEETGSGQFHFPRPMLHSGDLDFSFAGLKTSVLYAIKKLPKLTESAKRQIAKSFEDAVVDVLVAKTEKALREYEVKSLIVAGGVVANKSLQSALRNLLKKYPGIALHFPAPGLSGDNALMIALCGYINNQQNFNIKAINAEGNLRL